MKKFIAIYMAPTAEMDKMMSSMTPEQQKAGMDEWRKWSESHKEMVDIGAAFGKNLRVSKDGAKPERNEMGGYSFVEAESAEEAAALFKDSPHFQIPGAYIEIMPVMTM